MHATLPSSLRDGGKHVGKNAFGDVIHRFDNLAGIGDVKGMFYRFQDGKYIELTDRLFFIHSKIKNFPFSLFYYHRYGTSTDRIMENEFSFK